jgi:hypothetical protein
VSVPHIQLEAGHRSPPTEPLLKQPLVTTSQAYSTSQDKPIDRTTMKDRHPSGIAIPNKDMLNRYQNHERNFFIFDV